MDGLGECIGGRPRSGRAPGHRVCMIPRWAFGCDGGCHARGFDGGLYKRYFAWFVGMGGEERACHGTGLIDIRRFLKRLSGADVCIIVLCFQG